MCKRGKTVLCVRVIVVNIDVPTFYTNAMLGRDLHRTDSHSGKRAPTNMRTHHNVTSHAEKLSDLYQPRCISLVVPANKFITKVCRRHKSEM